VSAGTCPLCAAHGRLLVDPRCAGRYALCPVCGLVWLRPELRLNRAAEHRHYQTHDNQPDDPRYRAFLSQLWHPLRDRLPEGCRGLDFGSGPGPTLHLMAMEDGFQCLHYDPCFEPAAEVLADRYDFVTCSETAEHFFDPAAEFRRLRSLLNPGAWLAVMTLRLSDVAAFGGWHYHLDPTHVCFYQDATLAWIARAYGFHPPVLVSRRVALLQAADYQKLTSTAN
jgi:hypothetical protein